MTRQIQRRFRPGRLHLVRSEGRGLMTASVTPGYRDLRAPAAGDPITLKDGRLQVPTHPIIPFIEGDGSGPDIWRASPYVVDTAVKRAYGDGRRIVWFEDLAGEKAKNVLNSWRPDD